jgi:GT2 family glycosyltransferase
MAPMGEGNPLVVIVAYRNTSALANALRALGGVHDVLVIDNGADNGVRELVASAGAAYVSPGRNVGFAAAVNVALANRNGRDLLLVNPDARVSAYGIRRLLAVLEADRGLCAVAPRLVDEDGRPQRVEWPIPSPVTEVVKALGLERIVRLRATFLSGAVLLLNAEALDDVGLFDERYFLYAEECDWQLRALRRGWRAKLVDDVYARHLGGGSSEDEDVRNRFFWESACRFGLKWYGRGGWRVMRTSFVLGSVVRLVIAAPFSKERARYARQLRF